ncbi:inositol monophosphatase family protein [Erysipelothrix anatis]|uniref:inositol monophosphatase family protein n=1 Tax=Erysipelothrix anatis TaxID=2683713 RepID=UPI00135A5FCC|nr:inositol monophosphatase family protein [Erysipelothrix anatis]
MIEVPETKLEFTKELVRDTGRLIQSLMSQNLNIDTKQNAHDFVTNVDKQAEEFMVAAIQAMYPDQGFITEEKMIDNEVKHDMWIIDPIDGTTNFIFQKRNFAISVGYYEDGQPQFGIVYDVVGDEMYVGITGEGSYLNEQKLEPLDPKVVLKDAIVNADNRMFKTFKVDLDEHIMVQRYLGSAALEIIAVAAGRTNSYMSRRLKPWDIAAAVIILKEVGGTWYFGEHHDAIAYADKHEVFMSGSNATILESLIALR